MKLLLASAILFITQAIMAALPPLKSLDLVNAQEVNLVWDQESSASVVIFLSSSCPCSNAHIPHLAELAKKFPQFKFVAINSNADESVASAEKYFSAKNLPFPVIRDQKSHWANLLRAKRTPHAYIISTKGEVIYQGGVTSSAEPEADDTYYLQDSLTKLVAGKKITQTQTRVVGCEIAR